MTIPRQSRYFEPQTARVKEPPMLWTWVFCVMAVVVVMLICVWLTGCHCPDCAAPEIRQYQPREWDRVYGAME